MNKRELENLFSFVNYFENCINEIEDDELFEYVFNCIKDNEFCTIEAYEEIKGDIDE